VLIRALYPTLFSPDEGAGGDGGNGGDAGKTFTQAELDGIVKDRLTRERGKYADYDALKSKASELDTLKAASQSDIERITSERDTLKGQHGSLSVENRRLKVALAKGLTGERAELAELLQGDTEEAMSAHADKLLKLMGAPSTGFDGGARGGGDKPQDMDSFIRRAAGRAG
jgi:hypothetical protein